MLTLQPLNFSTDALEPYIGKQTLAIHHDKHHAAYVNKSNELIDSTPEVSGMSLEEIIQNISVVPEAKKQAFINNLGQVYNHNLYWESLAPETDSQKFEMSESFGQALDKFGSYENFQKLWSEAGMTQFGSGWVWLVVDTSGNLSVEKTANGDNPLFHNQQPIMTMDVWEHAYYLDYQNKRPDYISNFFKVINWKEVSRKYDTFLLK
jgi:superoxide dismutase, Fe-Mn family